MKQSVAEFLIDSNNLKLQKCNLRLKCVQDIELNVIGSLAIPFSFGERRYVHKVVVTDTNAYPGGILIGTDLLSRLGVIKLSLSDENNGSYIEIQNEKFKINRTITNSINCIHSRKEKTRGVSETVSTVERLEIEANSVAVSNVRTSFPNNSDVIIESKCRIPGLRISNTICTVQNNLLPIAFVNITSERIELMKNEKVGEASKLDDNELVTKIESDGCSSKINLDHLPPDEKEKFTEFLSKHENVISKDGRDIGYCNILEHESIFIE